MAVQLQIVAKKSLDLHAADALRVQITTGAAKPGSRLTEMQLSEQLGLSRGTVRAALQRLASEGLVEQTPYTGWQVATLTDRDVWELYTLRGSLEGLAARLAAQVCNSSTAIPLIAALQRLKTACGGKDRQAVAATDFDLHRTIVSAANHHRLLLQYTWVAEQVKMIIFSSNELIASLADIYEQHVPLVELVVANKADDAERAARWHNESEGRILAEHIASLSAGQ